MIGARAWWGLFAMVVVLALAPTLNAADRSGTILVRFDPSLNRQEMRDAVAAAGARVVADLSIVHALGVVPASPGAATRLRGASGVLGVGRTRRLASSIPADAAAEPSPAPSTVPDPLHDATIFQGEANPEGVVQWDDRRMRVDRAWTRTLGQPTIRVAVLDTGVQRGHKEVAGSLDVAASDVFIRCDASVPVPGLTDCGSGDRDGHGTWVASRIAGARNGVASNGVAPGTTIVDAKVIADGYGAETTWILAGLLAQCGRGVDIVNLSLGGYDDPSLAGDRDEFIVWTDAIAYCRALGALVVAAAGNDHVRVDRTSITLAGRQLSGVGRVARTADGISGAAPGESAQDLRGVLLVPAGVPGVLTVSSTNNAIGEADDRVAPSVRWPVSATGMRDQLAYYSNYGSRVDIAAPGGARKFNIPSYDGGPENILTGGWGTFGALATGGSICADASTRGQTGSACTVIDGDAYGWLQGTSMAAPNAVGVAALTLAARPSLRKNPDALVAALTSTARRDMRNLMGPSDATNRAPSFAGVPCGGGYCHVDTDNPISFSDAYGAGIVDADAATQPPTSSLAEK